MLGFGLAALAVLGLERGPTLGPSIFVVVGLLGLGLFATLVAISPRSVASVPKFRDLLRLTPRQPPDIQEQYLANFAAAIEVTETALKAKTKWFRIAVAAYLDALVIGAAATMLGV